MAKKTSPAKPDPDHVPRHWLIKSEPECYSIDDLARDRRTGWSGVRNYQARNFMRDGMSIGDLILYYHSNAEPPGVAGVARVSGEARPDPTALDPKDDHYDPKATKDDPIWMMVEVEFVERFPAVVSLREMKSEKELASMNVLRPGQRLSVMPERPEHFERVVALGRSAREGAE